MKFCKNPECGREVPDHQRRNNKTGRQEYCSLSCYSVASPKMLSVFARYCEFDFSQENFKKFLVKFSKKFASNISMARALEVSRSTLSNWLTKFSIDSLNLRPSKPKREKFVLKYRDVNVGDKLARIADTRARAFIVCQKTDEGVDVKFGSRIITLIPRILKLWKKVL